MLVGLGLVWLLTGCIDRSSTKPPKLRDARAATAGRSLKAAAPATATLPTLDSPETVELIPPTQVKLRYVFGGKVGCGTSSASQQEVVLITPRDSTRFTNVYQLRTRQLLPDGTPNDSTLTSFEGEWAARQGTTADPTAIIIDFYRGRRQNADRVASYCWAIEDRTLQPLGSPSRPADCVLRLRRTEEMYP